MISLNVEGLVNYIELNNKKFIFNGRGPKIEANCLSECNTQINIFEKDDSVVIKVSLENMSSKEISPGKVSLYLGIDCYMDEYPIWNEKLFPTMLRCEKDYFYGYFMNPNGQIMGIASPQTIPSYSILYNDGGHRIESVKLDIINPDAPVDRCNGCKATLAPHEIRIVDIYMFDVPKICDFEEIASKYGCAFTAYAQKYTVERYEPIKIYADKMANIQIISPNGKMLCNGDLAEEYGIYTVLCSCYDKVRELKVYCRKEWGFYLKSAREQAITISQKATTHCESWYGLFSGYLASKHYPDNILDSQIEAKFNEIMPYMFEFESGTPIVSPYRIQNVSTLISLLVDRYESNPEKYTDSLDIADRFASYLIKNQGEDGGYYGDDKTHYTCVIYVAKSIMELMIAEKKHGRYSDRVHKHFNSVKSAIDNLVQMLDNIGTEGEMTFEDGMIACSALQIAMFAFITPNDKEKYIKAAEYMMNKHMCLEQKMIPDCRMRGASLRFWESQYDILTTPNMMNSPHGWSAWTLYGKYYLYLLTGKECYLRELMDGLGTCVQLVTLDGKLRWGFVSDSCIYADVFVKDKRLENGYSGKYEPRIFGECYLDMISSWYCQEKQIPTGGHLNSLLRTQHFSKKVDNQGGCCDNDVHEVFKCLEETVLKKAFIHECDNGEYLCYGCKIDEKAIILTDEIDELIYSVNSITEFKVKNKTVIFKDGGVYSCSFDYENFKNTRNYSGHPIMVS